MASPKESSQEIKLAWLEVAFIMFQVPAGTAGADW